MDNERIREICLALPRAAETLNWGNCLVYWAGERELGGKMFALTNVDGMGAHVLFFHCGKERFHELLEVEGIVPAPHFARGGWVALERWNALRPRQIEEELQQAHSLIYERLPKKTKALLDLPRKEREKRVAEVLAEREKKAAEEAALETAKPSRKKAKAFGGTTR